ncbi:MAG TPA: O-antigen ligase family protein [Solirubrobacterales bacterium]
MSIRAPRSEIWLLSGFGLLAMLTGLLAGLDPRLAIAGALGIVFALIALTNLTTGLAIFTFLGFVVVLPNFAGQTLSIIKLAALPLLLSWLALVTREGSSRRTFVGVHPAISLVMLLFTAWATLSFVWAESGAHVLAAVFRYALAVILVFIVFTAVQKEKDVTMIVGAIVLGAVCAGVYGFLHPAQAQFGQVDRLSGTLGNPNELAAAMILGIGLSGGMAAIAKTPLTRGAAIGAAGVCLIAILQTGSRGGLIALGAMMIASVVLSRGRRLALTLVTLTVLLGGIGYVVTTTSYQSRERILHPGSGSGRTDIWTVGGRMVSAHPVTGVGAGNFTVSSIHYLLRPGSLPNSQYIADTPKVAENMYLEVLAELGFPGAILFVTTIIFGLGCSIAALSRYRRFGNRRMQALTTAIAVSLIGLLTADLFASEEYARELWLLVGLGPALLAMAKRSESDAAA